jgi:ubiquinone/menaquinone biosynthesis C-methylase UbiE
MTDHEEASARAYRSSRELAENALAGWKQAVLGDGGLAAGQTLLDVGAGTGGFARSFVRWADVKVLAVEPAEALRQLIPRHPAITVLQGRAEALPLPDAVADLAWLGSVLHHLSDLPSAADELGRVLKPRSRILIRNAFPGHYDQDIRVRYFPETAEIIDTYPTVDHVTAAFARAGYTLQTLRTISHPAATDLASYRAHLNRETDSKLRALSDDAFHRGLTRLDDAARANGTAPALSRLTFMSLIR